MEQKVKQVWSIVVQMKVGEKGSRGLEGSERSMETERRKKGKFEGSNSFQR